MVNGIFSGFLAVCGFGFELEVHLHPIRVKKHCLNLFIFVERKNKK